MKTKVTVFLSSHLLNEVEQICSHVTVINKGVALASGSIEEISSKLKAPLEIEAEVDNLSQAVIGNLKNLSFVKDVSKDGNHLRIILGTREDVRSEVSQAISSGKGIILSMNMKGGSLEDIFLYVVNGCLSTLFFFCSSPRTSVSIWEGCEIDSWYKRS